MNELFYGRGGRGDGSVKSNFRCFIAPCAAISWQDSRPDAIVLSRINRIYWETRSYKAIATNRSDCFFFERRSNVERKTERIFEENKKFHGCKLRSIRRKPVTRFARLLIPPSSLRFTIPTAAIEKRRKHSPPRAWSSVKRRRSSVENWTLVERDPWSGRVSSHRSRPAPFVPCGDSAAAATAPATHTLLAPTPPMLYLESFELAPTTSPLGASREKRK